MTKKKRNGSIGKKITAISKSTNTGMILDFSVLREGDEKLLQLLQSAIKNQQAVQFTYTNNSGETGEHFVEPIAVIYKWYAWYLLAYKLVRMESVCKTEDKFSKEHKPARDILNDCGNSYQGKDISTKVRLRCRGNAIHRIKEYLNGQLVETLEDGTVIMVIHIVENEQWWIGVVLSQGKEVEVIEPEHIKERITIWRCREWHLILRKNTKNFICRRINRRLLMFQRRIILRSEGKEIRTLRMARTSRQ